MLRYHYLFMLSGLLRIVCVLGLLPRLRQATETPAKEMWKAIAKETLGRIRHIRNLLRVKRLRKRYRKENDGQ